MVEEEPGQKDEQVGREDTLLRKKFVRLTIAVGAVLAVALLVSLGFALRWYLSPQTDLSISQRQALVQGLASAGQALAVLLTGAVALIGLYLTRQNTNKQLQQARDSTRDQLQQARESQERTQASAQETLRLTEQGQITERFTRAIDQLGATGDKGEKKLEIRLGGIYALERIDKESPKRAYHSTVMEVLTAYVRENSHWEHEEPSASTPGSNEVVEQDKGVAQEAQSTLRGLPTDIRAILDVLKRREEEHVPEENRVLLDLRAADLQGANLQGANLQGANLQGANLQGADLRRADLQRADLQRADLQRADLLSADLWRANLQAANLQGAILQAANLRRADLQGAHLQEANLQAANLQRVDLQRADLRRADLRRADLEKAILQVQGAILQAANLRRAILPGAYLQEAILLEADLQRADLQRAKGVTEDQIEWTLGSNETQLPQDLNRPELWNKRIEEQEEILRKRLFGPD